MNKIIFEDLCQNFIEEVNFLIPTEKNKFVDIVVSFDKANFGDEKKKNSITTIEKKTNEVFSKHWKIRQPTVEISTNPPCYCFITC